MTNTNVGISFDEQRLQLARQQEERLVRHNDLVCVVASKSGGLEFI